MVWDKGAKMLLNCTNHPYDTWADAQREAATDKFGEVVDFPFPKVEPTWDTERLRLEVGAYADKVEALRPDAVFAAGEFTFLFMLVDRLLTDGIEVVASCSVRNTVETRDANGNNVKTSVFVFERFRPYARWQDGKARDKDRVDDKKE